MHIGGGVAARFRAPPTPVTVPPSIEAFSGSEGERCTSEPNESDSWRTLEQTLGGRILALQPRPCRNAQALPAVASVLRQSNVFRPFPYPARKG